MNTRREVLAVYVRIRVPNTKLYWCHSRLKRVISGLDPLLDSFTCTLYLFFLRRHRKATRNSRCVLVYEVSNAIQMNSVDVKNTPRDFEDIRLH